MRKTLIIVVLLLIVLPTLGACASTPQTQITVTRVIDGDTIEVDIAGTIYKVRYIGIDTPELTDEQAKFCELAQKPFDWRKMSPMLTNMKGFYAMFMLMIPWLMLSW